MAEWFSSIDDIRKSLFRIATPKGIGTGFHLFVSENLCGIATAYHVLSHSYEWEDPIKLIHHESGSTRILRPDERYIYTLPGKDLAFIICEKGELELPQPFDLIAEDMHVTQGVELGWCGFPAVAPIHLCFFTGHVSAWLPDEEAYLIDGVVINGVSGGPAFSKERQLCGVVQAYIPNRAAGEALPGLCLIRDVAPYHARLKELESLEEAQAEADSAAAADESDASDLKPAS